MAGFERSLVSAFGVTLAVSSVVAFMRREEEFARRGGLKGTALMPDRKGRVIEYVLTRREGVDRPVLLLEAGLGAPLESWDWIDFLLSSRLDVLRYHRGGYARSTTRLPPRRIVETLLAELAPTGPLILAGHSLGALILCDALHQSPALRERTSALFMIDGTDERLLERDRLSSRRRGMFVQMAAQGIIGDVTGVNRWVQSRMERDVEYRPDIQRSFVVTSSSTRTQVAAAREYLRTPTGSQRWLGSQLFPVSVIAASDNLTQQQELAEYVGATCDVVPNSSHRSIIGMLPHAQRVAELILTGVEDAR